MLYNIKQNRKSRHQLYIKLAGNKGLRAKKNTIKKNVTENQTRLFTQIKYKALNTLLLYCKQQKNAFATSVL